MNEAKCAHLEVLYWTHTDVLGMTHGAWQCRNCDAKFVPQLALAASLARVEALEKAGIEVVQAYQRHKHTTPRLSMAVARLDTALAQGR
jgi:hypothetical protein